MAGDLRGKEQFKARLRAMGQEFKPMGKAWADETASTANRTAPRGATGRLSRSHKTKSATVRGAKVFAIFYGRFVNAGAGPHVIKARRSPFLIFNAGGRTIFAKSVQHRGIRGTRYVDRAAHDAARKHLRIQRLVDAWNRAA